MPLDEPRFTQAEVLGVTDLNPTVMQNWANRRLIELQEQNPGRAGRRLYSPMDVVKLATMRRLTGLGISVAVSAKVANEIAADRMAEIYVNWGTAERRYGNAVSCRVEEKDGELTVNWYRARKALYRALADGVNPDPGVYIQIEVDDLVFSVLKALMKILSDEIDERMPSSGGDLNARSE